MAKGKGLLRKKTARDRQIDAAIAAATSQQGSLPVKKAILVPRESVNGAASGGAQRTAPPTSLKPLRKDAHHASALELALKKVGFVPAKPEPPSEKPQPVQTAKPTAHPASEPKPPKPHVTAPTPAKSKAVRGKKAKQPKPAKVPKDKAKSKKKKAGLSSEQIALATQAERQHRNQERVAKAVATISTIHRLTNAELLDLWREQMPRAMDGQSNLQSLGQDYVDAIEGEWRRRTILARLDPEHFKWPSTHASPGTGAFGSIEHDEGMLSHLGYHVGRAGEPSALKRQRLLARIFEGQLPPVNDPEYMESWGDRGTPKRLQKMAESIASAVKSAKRRSADYSVAIEHWEEDLAYLHAAYYVGRFGFGWPAL